jgi:hypothetical protein
MDVRGSFHCVAPSLIMSLRVCQGNARASEDQRAPCGPSRPTRVGPVATQPQPVLDVGVVVFQPFASRAAIDIVLGQIAKSCLPKRPSDLAADVSGFGISL